MLAALFLVALTASAPVAAEPQSARVNHCIGDGGDLVYTDKPCTAIGARELADDGLARGPFMPAYRNGCIRSLREFAYELSSAIEIGDVNRLAALYRWNGTSTRAGYDVMTRLETIVERPLLQVEPVYPAPPAPSATPTTPTTPTTPGIVPAPPADPLALPTSDPFDIPPRRRGPPVALRLDQTLANGVTPAPTTLHLARELGCWWVSL